ncbi:MAG: DNA polymerase IV [Candidatus Omnitrophota bacterium]
MSGNTDKEIITLSSSAYAGSPGFIQGGMGQSCFGEMFANTIGKARLYSSLKGQGRSSSRAKADAGPKLKERRRAATSYSEFACRAPYPKAIVHIDCDAFFASCEQAREPRLKGLPLVTGSERGIIACASYEAKAFGVKRGVRLSEAKKLCPGLIILPSDYETYSIYSERMFDIIKRFTPMVEKFSIDEAFCDITGLRRIYRTSYPNIAREIKDEIEKELDVKVSVGLSLSNTLAKICSRYEKPDGCTAVPGYRLHELLGGMELDRVCGFGASTVELLKKHGVKDILGYIRRPVTFARRLLGKIGGELWHELRGDAVYKLCLDDKRSYLSISKTKTFTPPSGKKEFVKSQLTKNLESACIKLRRYKLSARALSIYMRRADFEGVGIEAKLNRHSSATLDFSDISSTLFELLFRQRCLYRATGVTLSDIVPEGLDDRTLFDDPIKISRITRLSKITDEINRKYGKHKIHLATSNAAIRFKKDHPRNRMAWRKKELLKGETFRKRLGIPLLRLIK